MTLPLELRLKYKLMSRNNALHAIHFPSSMREAAQARRRLAYEELLLLELHLLQEGMKRAWGKEPVAHVIDGSRRVAFELSLPFTLTDEQQQARDEILAAMAAPVCANHLLLGDVGTGKTVVAGCAVAAAADTGGQTLFLAPTEVLAQQHAAGLGGLLEGVGVRVGLLTGSTSAHERAHLLQQFAAGELDMLVGTHALLSDDVVGKNVTLVVIDEQQRFGVNQRAALLAKGEAPDAIYLTATPIPRSMALAMFGNLTLSYLKKRPKAGVQRSTKVVARELRGEAFEAAREALERGEQVYVVCPLIGVSAEERDASSAGKGEAADAAGEAFHPTVSIEDEADYTHDNVGAAVQEAERLSRGAFAGYEVALLHGGMSPREKHEVMERFRAGEVQVLVATTVIEVGVDVPNATIMIVEDADRFGLSQLHQLRGRVGRGSKDAQVFLLSASQREESLARLRAMETTDDGFELATFDLSLRREGDILGNRQSGASSLKMVNITKDGAIVEAARSDAHDILAFDPQLEDADHRALARELRLVFGGTSEVVGG
jgi:ATP-dependent DNA helicase RecG